MIFHFEKAVKLEFEGFVAFIYNSKRELGELSSVYVECHGTHARVSVIASFRLYFVLEGAGIFEVGGEEEAVMAKDVIIVPPRVPYSYKGQMKMFEVNAPATGPEDERAEPEVCS